MAAPSAQSSGQTPLMDLNEPAGHISAAMVTSQTISADEVALYDRQIRLWGMEAQARMRNAKVLIISMRALANEVAKNLVLAGIGSLTVMDPEVVEADDFGAQFFISEEHIGMNRAEAAAPAIQRLNPRVPVHIDTGRPEDKPSQFYQQFDLVIPTDLGLDVLLNINAATREAGRPFYAASTYGLYGFIFADLLKHEFVVKRVKSNRATELKSESRTRKVTGARETKEGDTIWEFVTKEEVYVPLSSALSSQIDKTWRPRKRKAVPAVLPGVLALLKFEQSTKHWPDIDNKEDVAGFTSLITEVNEELGLPDGHISSEFIRSFLSNASAELSPVAAVLGGILAQDAINVLAKMEQPVQNILVFDGAISAAPILVLALQDDA
ncbi:hypothetical protein EX30DRAFT_354297 [Ascodesmis nigricans]|uniref:Ubiquitin-like 1-activating enzyme E1A n=1 Tax=Ascodesmis nigricans TaxID=341454 RepID=A0A4S2N1Y4_9PEZI|nr:hypothetical protein EX30DRAFT_354297 [Ascodesmis nigricans]